MKSFLKTTIVGGIIFLLPLAVVLLILSHAMRAATKVAEPQAMAIVKSIGAGSAAALRGTDLSQPAKA